MSEFTYVKVGKQVQAAFVAQNRSTGAALTGLSFNIEVSKNGVGNQATTGITVAQVDVTHNPGLYSVTCDPATSFAAGTGFFTLQLVDGADATYQWPLYFAVTADGTAAGTVGPAQFIPTAANGRIVDGGGSPLAGASVYIRNQSTAAVVSSFTTDSSGLWGPVYLANGTYVMDVEKANYSGSNSGIITVSGGAAVGPMQDVAISIASTVGTLTYAALSSYARKQMLDASGAKADQEIQDSINDALSMIAKRRQWLWFKTQGSVTLNAFYQTGIVTATNGSPTLTLSGGTWPSWASAGELMLQGQFYYIQSVDSPTQITMTSIWPSDTVALASGNWAIYQDSYLLPANCMRFYRPLYGKTSAYRPEPVSFEELFTLKSDWQFFQNGSAAFCIQQGWVKFWPAPQVSRQVNFAYYRKPASISQPNDIADWDPLQGELLYRSIDYQLALRGQVQDGTSPDQVMALFKDAFEQAVDNDKGIDYTPSPMDRAGRLRDFNIPAR